MENSGRADIYTEIGDLYLQFHQYGDAVKAYGRAIAADSKWVPAYLGDFYPSFFRACVIS